MNRGFGSLREVINNMPKKRKSKRKNYKISINPSSWRGSYKSKTDAKRKAKKQITVTAKEV